MGAHLIDGDFQSDKYPSTPRGKVPLSVKDPLAQDLLWEYAQRRRAVDAEFSDDLETALRAAGYEPSDSDGGPGRVVLCGEAAEKFLAEMVRSRTPEEIVKHAAFMKECEAAYKGTLPPIDWSGRSPKAVFESLKAAPKVAGPWTKTKDSNLNHEARYAPTGVPVISKNDLVSGYAVPVDEFEREEYATRAEADARLRALGWLLVDEAGGNAT